MHKCDGCEQEHPGPAIDFAGLSLCRTCMDGVIRDGEADLALASQEECQRFVELAEDGCTLTVGRAISSTAVLG